jgi:hypothetical protein
MTNVIANWWRARQFSAALKQNNTRLAERLLEDIQKSGARLSLLQQQFRNKLHAERYLHARNLELAALRRQLDETSPTLKSGLVKQNLELEKSLERHQQEIKFLKSRLDGFYIQDGHLLLQPDIKFVKSVISKFNINQTDNYLLECPNLDGDIFYDFELHLAEYLKHELSLYTPQTDLIKDLQTTYQKDIGILKRGKDPQYDSYLSPHIYFMVYFLEGVYSAYLAWFLVYKSGLLPATINILDIGAGSGAMLYGLFSFLRSANSFAPLPQSHISYLSLELQDSLQHHGFKFWQQYIETRTPEVINTYCRFKKFNLFAYGSNNEEARQLPKNHFDFIVISHCIFAEQEQRYKSNKIYKKIFSESLKNNGYVLIVVQGRRLFQAYGRSMTENQSQEQKLIEDFIEELGLNLEWYKYMTSTGKRIPMGSGFAKFASENLPHKKYMGKLMRHYLEINYDPHYVLDDYVILAKK